jgi:hypothetical protein
MSDLSIQQLSELGNIATRTLHNWMDSDIITPDTPGTKGRGLGCRFDLMKAVGIVVAAAVHQSQRGCVPSYVKVVVDAFAATTEEELLKSFNVDGHYLAAVVQGRPVLRSKSYDWPNVKEAYDKVKMRVARG